MKHLIKVVLAFTLIIGQLPLSVLATEKVNIDLADGAYPLISTAVTADDSSVSSAANTFLKGGFLNVQNGELQVNYTFSMGQLMKDIEIFVEGQKVSHTESLNSGNLLLSFNISSLEQLNESITLNMTISLMNKVVDFRMINTIEGVEIPDGGESGGITNPDGGETNPNPHPIVPSVGNYQINTEALQAGTDKPSAAANFMNPISLIEVTEDDMYLTLRFTGKTAMSDQVIKVNGSIVSFENPYETESDIHFKFKIESLDDAISMTANILGMMTVDFDIALDIDSLVEITDEVPTPNPEPTPDLEPTPEETPETPNKNELANGVYTIENSALHLDKDEDSIAAQYLNRSCQVDVTDSGMYLTLKFTGKSMMANHNVYVNEKNTGYSVVYNSGDDIHLKFKMSSLSDSVTVSTTVLGSMNVSFRVILDKATLVQVSGQTPTPAPEVTPDDSDNNESNGSSNGSNNSSNGNDASNNNGSTGSQLVSISDLVDGGTYSLTNQIVTDSDMGYTAARNALNSTTYLELKNGAYYLTFGFGNMDLMTNLRVYVNGSQVSYETLRSSETTKDIKFKLNSLTDSISIKAYIPAMGRDITFGVKLNTNAIYQMSGSQVNQPLGSTNDSLDFLQTSTEEEEDTLGEELEVSEYMKRYSILNDVLSSSETGIAMARKYLEEESLLEDVDGTLYLSLTFSGANLMNNVSFTVNGEAVTHEVTDEDSANHLKTYRFIIENIEDEIQAHMYIIPVGMDISFGIKLLADTMTLLDEATVSIENVSLTDGEHETEEDEASLIQDKENKMTVVIIAVIGAIVIVVAGTFVTLRKRSEISK